MLAAVLALLSAFLFALGSAAQQKVASSVPTEQATGFRLVAILAKRPFWLMGVGCDGAAYLCQAGALAEGSLLLVQPLIVTTLLFALPISARMTGRKLHVADGVWAVIKTAALAVFVVAGNPSEGKDLASFSRWAPTLIAVLAVIALCFVVGRAWRPGAAALIAAAGGGLFGVGAALTKSTMNLLAQGIPTLVTSWELYALIAAGVAGAVVQEDAFQAGDIEASLPALTILEPIVAAVLGVAVLDERIRATGFGWVLIAVSVVAMAVAAIQLARRAAQLEMAATPPPAPTEDAAL